MDDLLANQIFDFLKKYGDDIAERYKSIVFAKGSLLNEYVPSDEATTCLPKLVSEHLEFLSKDLARDFEQRVALFANLQQRRRSATDLSSRSDAPGFGNVLGGPNAAGFETPPASSSAGSAEDGARRELKRDGTPIVVKSEESEDDVQFIGEKPGHRSHRELSSTSSGTNETSKRVPRRRAVHKTPKKLGEGSVSGVSGTRQAVPCVGSDTVRSWVNASLRSPEGDVDGSGPGKSSGVRLEGGHCPSSVSDNGESPIHGSAGHRIQKKSTEDVQFTPRRSQFVANGPRQSFPRWLTASGPRPTSYFPQVDDIVYYLLEEYRKFVDACHAMKICSAFLKDIQFGPPLNINIKEVEILRIRNVTFRLCNDARVAEVEVERCSPRASYHKRFKLWWQEIPNVQDFLVLKQMTDRQCSRAWNVGERMRSLFDEESGLQWFKGTIQSVSKGSEFVPGLQRLRIRWDLHAANAYRDEEIACYDAYPLTAEQNELADGTGATRAELRDLAYVPAREDWDGDYEAVRNRILHLLGRVRELDEAEPFSAPVDLELYPSYPSVVAYPVDLHTISQRLEKGFYRRKKSLVSDFRQIAVNAKKFNKPFCEITRSAHIIEDFCCQIVSHDFVDDSIEAVYQQCKEKWTTAFEKRKKSGTKRKIGPFGADLLVDAPGEVSSFAPKDGAAVRDCGSGASFSSQKNKLKHEAASCRRKSDSDATGGEKSGRTASPSHPRQHIQKQAAPARPDGRRTQFGSRGGTKAVPTLLLSSHYSASDRPVVSSSQPVPQPGAFCEVDDKSVSSFISTASC